MAGKKRTPEQRKRRAERRKVKRASNMAAIGMEPAPVPYASNNRQGRRFQKNRVNYPRMKTEGASTVMEYEELLPDLTSGVGNYAFSPGSSGLKFLDAEAKRWDQYRLESACIRYATSVGVNNNGHLHLGIDYSAATTASTRQDVSALFPRADGPIYENLLVHVDPKLAMSKPIMYSNSADTDNTAFVLSTFSDMAQAGLLWVSYRVRFTSPSNSASTSGPVVYGTAVANLNDKTAAVVGVPDVDVNEPSTFGITTVKPQGSAPNMTSEFQFDGAVIGQQFVASSIVPSASSQNGGTLTVQFIDKATGSPLPPTVVKQVSAGLRGPDGIWAAVWAFVRPWVKPFLLNMVETLVVSSAGNSVQTNEVVHLVSDLVPVSAVSTVVQNPIGDIMTCAVLQNSSTTFFNPTGQSGYLLTFNGSGANGTLTISTGTNIPAGSVIAFNYSLIGTSVLGTVTTASGVDLVINAQGTRSMYGTLYVGNPTTGVLCQFPVTLVTGGTNDRASLSACIIGVSQSSAGSAI